MSPSGRKDITIIIAIYGPLLCAIIFSMIFYLKSIKVLREQSEYEQASTKLYVKNLQYYCFAQFVLYVPAMIYLWGLSGLLDILNSPTHYALSNYSEGIASLAGFVNSVIFLKQGSIKEYKTPKDRLHLDVTQDLSLLA